MVTASTLPAMSQPLLKRTASFLMNQLQTEEESLASDNEEDLLIVFMTDDEAD